MYVSMKVGQTKDGERQTTVMEVYDCKVILNSVLINQFFSI